MFQRKLKIILFICISSLIRAEEIPDCDYFDTVDLTYSENLTNGSYIYENVLIPPEQTGNYTYKILFEGTKITVKKHLRGCVCKFKPCIRYCCHRHRLDMDDEGKCTKEFNDDQVNITLEDGTEQEISIRDHFVVQPGINIECDKFLLDLFGYYEDWKLSEDGTLYLLAYPVNLSKRDYCLQPKENAIQGLNYMLLPLNCLMDFNFQYVDWTSLFFVLLTILIYIFVIKRQHAYDKCWLCYLICYSIHFLINILIDNDNFLLGITCYIVAYLSYFFKISIYLWLSVMSFDFFRNFGAGLFVTIQYNEQSRFLKYSLFVWGMTSAFLLITILADHLLDNLKIDSNWKMGYAYYGCYLQMFDWSIFVYLTGPATLMLIIKATFMIATVWHVHIKYRENRKQLEELGQQQIESNMMFIFYFRTLATQILNWLSELCYIIYNIPIDETEYFYNILGHLHPIYCILIFAITVTRRDVRQLLARRSPRTAIKLHKILYNSIFNNK